MNDNADFETWDKLYRFMSQSVENGIEREWLYGDMQVWPIIRSQICMRGSNVLCAGREHMRLKGASTAKIDLKNAKQSFSRALLSKFRRQKPTQAVDLNAQAKIIEALSQLELPLLPSDVADVDVWCVGYAANHKQVGDHFFQLCMDPLRVALSTQGVTSIGLMTGVDADGLGVEMAAAKPTMSIDADFNAIRKMASKLPKVDLSKMPGFDQWWQELELVLDGNNITSRDHIATVIRQTAVTGAWLHKALAHHKPKALFVASYYGLIGHGGSWACQKLGIPVIDVQHGVSGIGHHAYDWPMAPADGYNTVPSHFLKWSEREQNDMRESSGSWTPELFVCGNNWRLLDDSFAQKLAVKGKPKDVIVSEAVRKSSQKQMASWEKKILSLKKQDIEGVDILIALHPDEEIEWFEEMKTLAPDNWRFWVRLHPGEYKQGEGLAKREEALNHAVTNIKIATEAPLNVLLANVDAIITKYSSVALDGLAYGVPTVSYSPAGKYFLGPSERSNIRYVHADATSIVNGLKSRISSYGSDMIKPQGDTNLTELGEELSKFLS